MPSMTAQMAHVPAMAMGRAKIAISKSSIVGSGVVRLASLPPDPYIIAAYIPSVNKKVKVFSPVFIGIVAIVLWRSCIDGNSFF